MRLLPLEPLTDNQSRVFDAWDDGQHLVLSGSAGTGKTIISLYLGLDAVEKKLFERVVVVRSLVSGRDPGFLPGTLHEKSAVYEAPYLSICQDLYGRGDSYPLLKQNGVVEFLTTSFLRGITLKNCVVLVDEIQNCKTSELDSVITRMGENSRLICVGDFRQTDLIRSEEKRGISDFIRIANEMSCFTHVEFSHKDIVRSGLVRDYLITRDKLGIIP